MIAAFRVQWVKELVGKGKQAAEWVLTRVFSRLIPVFVLGFVARMYQTKVLGQMLTHYGDLLLWLVFFLVLYIALLFFLGSGRSRFLTHVKHLLPAAGVAFSSGCSLSTMPWTIEGSSKNLENPDLAKAVIPATTNIQQIGDCIANAFLCFLIYRHFHGFNPDFITWLSFSFVFVLARFATAAVLGGAIFIMIPIYEAYLGFNGEMTALILAFNVILDPLITCSNVVANGALCRLFERAWGLIVRRPVALD
jgi:Na+/H+-dicarboxylate symporter